MSEHREPLQRQLALTRRRWRATRVLGGLAWAFVIVVGLVLVCFHLDRRLALSSIGRLFWLLGIGGAALIALAIGTLRPMLRRVTDKDLALDVERRYPVLMERLLT